MKKVLISFVFLVIASFVMQAQTISVDDAVAIALKNNYSILISRASADIDKANNTAGNAGMLPSIGVNGSDYYAINNVAQDQSNGVHINSANATSNTFNVGVALGWTLFDGGKMFVTRKKAE